MAIFRSIQILMIAILFSASSVQANEALLNHLHHVSQAMSALYMHGLSEGNEKYQNEFEQYKYNALLSLKKYFAQGGSNSSDLLKRWQDLSGDLNLKYTKDFGWDLCIDRRHRLQSVRGERLHFHPLKSSLATR